MSILTFIAGASTAIDYARMVLAGIGPLIQMGKDVTDILTNADERLDAMQNDGRGPTKEEWDAVNASIDAKRKVLHGP